MKERKKLHHRPLKLSIEEHRELIRRKEAGQNVAELAVLFNIRVNTVYIYLARDPDSRTQ